VILWIVKIRTQQSLHSHMNIAVMVSLLPTNANMADRNFFNHTISHLITQQAQHHYYICTDAPREIVVKSGNVTPVLVPYINSSKRLFPLWQQVKYGQLLKKLDARVCLCFGASLYIKARVPYCVIINPKDLGNKPLRSFGKVVGQARSLLTFSEAAKTAVCEQYKVPAEKIGVVHAAASEAFKPTDADLNATVKERYTGGCEYFIYTGSFEDHSSLIDLLKAFSIFKKRQKTSWKLLMVNREPDPPAKFTEALRTYKYREDVVVLQHIDENLSSLLGAAYAFVYPVAQEDYGLYILEAMRSGLPVVAIHHQMLKEITGEAAIYYDGSVNDLAEKMMTIYKYEAFKGQQVEKVKEIIQKYSWQKTAEEIWRGLETANS
jgi:glycosyltransferase involved in cell wall biosynthesis